MFSGASPRRPFVCAAGAAQLCRVLALLLAIIPANGYARQTKPSRSNAQQTSQISPLLQEAEELLRQGSSEEAKKKVQEELEKNPSSLEGYNLLGIIYTTKKTLQTPLLPMRRR